jgi:hypothetical protein
VLLILAALIVSAAVAWSVQRLIAEMKAQRREQARSRTLKVFATFAPAARAASEDPRALLAWAPLARTARTLFPDEFADLDRASGGSGSFPFGRDRIEAAHAQWTSDWLTWEAAHAAEYKSKAVALQEELDSGSPAPGLRARLEAVERDKLDQYQRHYQEYVRVAKALQQLNT